MANESVSALWGEYNKGTASSALDGTRKANSDLDKNAFLNLLITQMKYQDPLNPTEDKEFLAQMAQFTSLEQMQNINKVSMQSQAFGLVGKTVVGTSYNSETLKYTDFSGRAESATIKNGEAYLTVNGLQVKLSEVTDVFEDYMQMGVWQSMNNNIFNQQGLSLVGRTIQAITMDADGNADGFVEGKVEFIRFTGQTPVLVIGDKEVFPQEVISVADENMLIGKTIKATVLVDGVYTEITAPIDGVKIRGDAAYLQMGGHEVLIDKIDKVTEAIRWNGRNVKYGDVDGIVDGVLVKSKTVFLTVGDQTVEFDKVRPKSASEELEEAAKLLEEALKKAAEAED